VREMGCALLLVVCIALAQGLSEKAASVDSPGPVDLGEGNGGGPSEAAATEAALIQAGDPETCLSILEDATAKNSTYRPGHLGERQDNPDVDACVSAMKKASEAMAEQVAELTNQHIDLLREQEIARLKPVAKRGDAITTYPDEQVAEVNVDRGPTEKEEKQAEKDKKVEELKAWAKEQINVKLMAKGDKAMAELNSFMGAVAKKSEYDDSVWSSKATQAELEENAKEERYAVEQALVHGDDSQKVPDGKGGKVGASDYSMLEHLSPEGKANLQKIVSQFAQLNDITPTKVIDAIIYLKTHIFFLSPQGKKVATLLKKEADLTEQAQNSKVDAKDVDAKAKQAVEKLKFGEKRKEAVSELTDALTKELPAAIKEAKVKAKTPGSQQMKLKKILTEEKEKADKTEAKRINKAAKKAADENNTAKPLTKEEEEESKKEEMKEVKAKSRASSAANETPKDTKKPKPAPTPKQTESDVSEASDNDNSFVYSDSSDAHSGSF